MSVKAKSNSSNPTGFSKTTQNLALISLGIGAITGGVLHTSFVRFILRKCKKYGCVLLNTTTLNLHTKSIDFANSKYQHPYFHLLDKYLSMYYMLAGPLTPILIPCLYFDLKVLETQFKEEFYNPEMNELKMKEDAEIKKLKMEENFEKDRRKKIDDAIFFMQCAEERRKAQDKHNAKLAYNYNMNCSF